MRLDSWSSSVKIFRRNIFLIIIGGVSLALLTGCGSLLPQPSNNPPTSVNSIPTDIEEVSIVFIGDSIMSGYGTENEEGWPDILAKESERPILNLGCAGAGFVSVGVCGENYAGLVLQAAASNPQVVVIQGSDNDFGYDYETVKDATEATVEELRALLPNTRIIGLNTVMWRYDEVSEAVDTTSELLKVAVEKNDGDFVDIGQPTAGVESYIQEDLEHPNVEGQEFLAKTVKDALASANVFLEYTY